MTYFKQFQRKKTHVECGWTPDQIAIALDFARRLEETGASDNCFFLMIEGLVDGYMRSRFSDSTAGVYKPAQTKYWSERAIAAYKRDKAAKLIVEHGTPRRQIARKAFKLYKDGKCNEQNLDEIGRQFWKTATITKEEAIRLDKIARSTLYPSPDERWAAAGIEVVPIKGFDEHMNILV